MSDSEYNLDSDDNSSVSSYKETKKSSKKRRVSASTKKSEVKKDTEDLDLKRIGGKE